MTDGGGSFGLANVSQQLVEASVAKIVAWTSDIRSAEVRRASQDALYALFSLHPSEVTRILSNLPKVCQVVLSLCSSSVSPVAVRPSLFRVSITFLLQDSASQVIQQQLNRASDTASFNNASMTGSACSSPLKSPLSPSSEPTTPSRLPVFTSDLSSHSSKKVQETVELNPEEVYR